MKNKKINFRVKGSVLVEKSVLRDVPLGTKGFLMASAIAIYQDKLYLNTIVSYSLIENGAYIIPFKRISKEVDGFEISFEHISVSYIEYITEPRGEYWIGPFDVETEENSLENYYGNVPLEQIIEIWNQLLINNLNSQLEQRIRKIKREIFYRTYNKLSLIEFDTLTTSIQHAIDDIQAYEREYNTSDEYDAYEHQVNTVLIEEYQHHLQSLNKIYDGKIKNLSLLNDEELAFLIDKVNVDSPKEEFLLAKDAKEELNKRKKIIMTNSKR